MLTFIKLKSCLQSLNSFSLNSHPSPLIIHIKSIPFSLGQLDFNIQFLWVPSHVGIRGNEYADSLAKSSSNFISPSFSPIPWSDFTPLLRHHIFNLWSAYWHNLPANFASKYKSIVPNIINNIWFKNVLLPRAFIVQFNRLRIGRISELIEVMDNFGDNFDDGDVDPAAEFLAREQTQLAGLEDDLNTPNVPIGVTQTLSNGSGSSFEIIDSAENQLTNPVIENGLTNGFTVTNSDDEKKLVSPKKVYTSSPIIAPKIEREEPEKIKKWREEQKARLEEKDADEEKKKEELRLVAKSELEEWYKIHKEQIAKTKDVNRESAINAEKQFVAESDEIEPGTEWDRISKLCDFNPKSSRASKDVTRMRSIILQLKQTPLKKPVSPAK
ncbi:hypothetical protein QTP88_022167 [Uroleucon formosanum]